MKKTQIAARAAGAGIIAGALLLSPNKPLFMKENDPYASLRKTLTTTQKLQSAARAFMSIEKARASGPSLAVPMNSLRSAVGFVMGYGSRQAYIDFACDGTDPGDGQECDGPPEDGLVGKMAEVLNTVPAALESAGVLSCAAIPNSGSTSISLGGTASTLTFGTATQSIPAAWDDGGTAFTKRLEFAYTIAGSTTNFAAEFACGTEGILLAINMNVGAHAPGYTRPINVWVGEKAGVRVADVYVSEVNSSDNVRGAYAYSLKVDESTSTYQLGGSATTWFSGVSNSGVDRVHIHGNYSTGQASIYLYRAIVAQQGTGSNTYISAGDFTSIGGGAVTDTVGSGTLTTLNTATATTAGTTASYQGCVDFDSPGTDPSGTTLCTGLALNALDAPVIDATGNFGAEWMIGEMHDHLVALPSI